jgi:hypothetical protein
MVGLYLKWWLAGIAAEAGEAGADGSGVEGVEDGVCVSDAAAAAVAEVAFSRQ